MSLALTPTGRLHFVTAASEDLTSASRTRIVKAFERGAGHGILELGLVELAATLPPDLAYFRELAQSFLTSACGNPDLETPGRAVHESGSASDKATLLSLLVPVEKAAKQSAFLRELVDSGDLFHPLAWTPRDAYRFLLGSAKTFRSFTKKLAANRDYAPLRNLVRPYLLRRLKTDKRVIADLPDKTELHAFCSLTKAQAERAGAQVRLPRNHRDAGNALPAESGATSERSFWMFSSCKIVVPWSTIKSVKTLEA